MTPNSPAQRAAPHAANAYAQAAIENAPPLKLVCLLYQGAIRFLDTAAACPPAGAGSKFHEWLTRAEDIVVELRLSLDDQSAPELAGNLSDLYLFAEHEIQRARREQSVQPLAGARDVLAKLLEAWTAIETGKA